MSRRVYTYVTEWGVSVELDDGGWRHIGFLQDTIPGFVALSSFDGWSRTLKSRSGAKAALVRHWEQSQVTA